MALSNLTLRYEKVFLADYVEGFRDDNYLQMEIPRIKDLNEEPLRMRRGILVFSAYNKTFLLWAKGTLLLCTNKILFHS
jgi:hypothetical protein